MTGSTRSRVSRVSSRESWLPGPSSARRAGEAGGQGEGAGDLVADAVADDDGEVEEGGAGGDGVVDTVGATLSQNPYSRLPPPGSAHPRSITARYQAITMRF
ncbi:hypothetical protein [Streptomyces sp. NPDC053755]|uniref:hypothetical protein n=1 Tax=Streptomyces sp. NPDC053755 TaxID=3155815 RepID=UPI0034325428